MMNTYEPTRDRGPRRGAGRRRGGPHRRVMVSSVRPLSEHLVRVVATGELRDWDCPVDGGHFKVFLPQPDGTEAMRTYTVRRYDAARGELTIDFALHADGPATRFARRAIPGDPFEISGGARQPYQPRDDSAWTVMFADQSALPAVCAIAESLPAGHRLHAVVEIPSLEEELPVTSGATVDVTWVGERDAPCRALVEQALGLRLPDGVGEVWVGCEAGAVRQIRRHLLGELGLDRDRIHTRAYWKQGTAAHSDHDTGEDDCGERGLRAGR